MSGRRNYGQFCGLASALDVLGERWTLLVIRELLIGPARFGDILDNLPGIGPNLLADRLRTLTDRGLIATEQVIGDKRGKRYRLTDLGEGTRGPVLGLARWGLEFLTEDLAVTGVSRASWGFLAVQAMIDPSRLPDVSESYEFRIDDEAFHIDLDQGRAATGHGPATDPVLTVRTDAPTFIRIGAGLLDAFDAVLTGKVKAEGDPSAVQRCALLLGLR